MKGFAAIALLCALGTAAAAKPAPVGQARSGLAFNDADINISANSPAREREYFQAPQAQFNAGGLVCRLPVVVFDKTRLASSCH